MDHLGMVLGDPIFCSKKNGITENHPQMIQRTIPIVPCESIHGIGAAVAVTVFDEELLDELGVGSDILRITIIAVD